MSEPPQLWQYIIGDQQLGPVTSEQLLQLAANGDISPETYVWTEGLEDWALAAQVEGLFPAGGNEAQEPQTIPGGAPQAPPPPAPVVPPPRPATAAVPPTGIPSPSVPAPAAVPPAAATPLAAAPAPVAPAPPGQDYPAFPVTNANFGLLITFLIGTIVLSISGLAAFGRAEPPLVPGQPSGGVVAGWVLCGLASVSFLVFAIVALQYLHRAWSCLRHAAPRTTPGKAVGFLFIPFFNLYWLFVAFHGLAKDWNRTMDSYPDLAPAPRFGKGAFLTFCIGSIVFPPLAFVMLFPVYKSICDGINHMHSRGLRKPPGAMPGAGIRLY